MLKLSPAWIFLNPPPLRFSAHYPSGPCHPLACLLTQELVELINSNRVLVVSGETGCGKTTQVPQFILDDYINRGMGSLCRVVCTQPRRISAISVCAFQIICCCVQRCGRCHFSCIDYFNCPSCLSGSRAGSGRESRKRREWKFLWLPNPPAEVRKQASGHTEAVLAYLVLK